ncbi:hypothetical protein ACFLVC_04510 [Chloroflexota bacterium]
MTTGGRFGNYQFSFLGIPSEAGEGLEPIPAEESERRFRQMMEEPLSQVAEIGSVDIVVGIPFYNEADTIASVVETAREGLEEFYPGQKAIIAAVGSPMGDECLKVLSEIPQGEAIRHIAFLLRDENINGKGWAIRAAMEIAQTVAADFQLVGYVFFIVGMWYLCGLLGPPAYLLNTEKVQQFGSLQGAQASAVQIFIYFILGWLFTFLSQYKSTKAIQK